MNANELTMGIELEVIIPRETAQREHLNIGSYHSSGIQVPFLPQGWVAKSDSSVSAPAGYIGCEFVSPILKGEEGIKQVIEVVRILREKNCKVNFSTGTHIHVNFNPEWCSEKLARLVCIASYLEKGIYATTGSKRREQGTYCQSVRRYGNQSEAKKCMSPNRYHFLNIHNLAQRTKDTVEFRAFSGSLNETKIVGWIQLCLGVVEKALNTKRLPKWTPSKAKCFWAKEGEGQTELSRMLSYLGWSTGYAKNIEGRVYGIITDIIPLNEIKKEFRRLAKKYDSEQ